ncbi:MAG: hypothetical protein KBD31_02450 [Proteobacteria bacterium]|nr:hypothetical protein [Pseudomonadota bacterium]
MTKRIVTSFSIRKKLQKDGYGYRGSFFWLIVFFILFFPIGILLLMRNTVKRKDGKIYFLEYQRSWKWIFFWGIVFFPIAFFLFIFNGISFVEEDNCCNH